MMKTRIAASMMAVSLLMGGVVWAAEHPAADSAAQEHPAAKAAAEQAKANAPAAKQKAIQNAKKAQAWVKANPQQIAAMKAKAKAAGKKTWQFKTGKPAPAAEHPAAAPAGQ